MPTSSYAVPGPAEVVPPRVALESVSKWYGDRHALVDIDLTVARGDVVAVIGPSGSGKSTLCRAVNGLERIDSGTIRIDGAPLPRAERDLPRMRAEVGMVFQSFNLYAAKTVLDNVVLGPLRVRRQSRDTAVPLGLSMLERVGLEDVADRYPEQLSGGQQQRVAIARALAMHPKVLLFDEPTSALDPEMTTEVLDVMADLARAGMTMLVVTHEMGFARAAAHRIAFLADGRIVEEASPEEFFARPRTERASAFLSKLL